MNRFFTCCTAVALNLFTATALAAPPKHLITHNHTDSISNAFVAGTIPSQHPTHAHSDGVVAWGAVKLACFGHTNGDKCSALIVMDYNTDHQTALEFVTMDLKTGDITPKHFSVNGYTMTVNGPGETTITKN